MNHLKRIKALLLFSLTLGCAAPLNSCAARPKQINILDNQTYTNNSTRFIFALFKQDNETVISLTAYPFYLNHQGIINTAEEWGYILGQTTQNTQSAGVSILSLEAYPAERLRSEKPVLWGEILEAEMEAQHFILAKLLINQEQQENVLLFMNPVSGKISGFVR